MGEAARLPPTGWTGMTTFHIVYPEAQYANGPAKTLIACNINIRRYKSWGHLIGGGWVALQSAPSDFVTTGRFDGPQTGNSGTDLTVTLKPDGTFSEPSPPVGYCNHGWVNSRGSFTANSLNGVFSIFEMRVDKENANLIAASGNDWWQTPSAAFPNNTGYTLSAWVRLTTQFRAFCGTAMTQAQLQADPPPVTIV